MDLTTNLTEMNKLYGKYFQAVAHQDGKKALDAWMEYYAYACIYHKERGIPLRAGQM